MEDDARDIHSDLKLPCVSGGNKCKQNPENGSAERSYNRDADPIHEVQSDGKDCYSDAFTLPPRLDSSKLSPNLEEVCAHGTATLQTSEDAATADVLDT